MARNSPRGRASGYSGTFILHGTYGHYAGRYTEAQVGVNTHVGAPDFLTGIYIGPGGSGRAFAPGFNPANYEITEGTFPTANVSVADDLSSPLTREFTLSTSGISGTVDGRVSYVWRRTSDVFEDFIDLTNGATDVVSDGIALGRFTNVVYRDTDLGVRRYQAAVLQGRYRAPVGVTVDGAWTIQLENDGNYEGEAFGDPRGTSVIGDYPEAFAAERHYPTGRLADFQRHRARLWAIYTHDAGRVGAFTVSGLVRVESARTFSLRASNQPLSAIQRSLIAAYPDAPVTQEIYFNGRGSERFAGYRVLDASLNYDIPVFRSLRPWLKLDVFNIFNNDKVVAWDTTVFPDASSPKDQLGLPTGYRRGARFGTPTSNSHYAPPRVFRMALGVRF